MELKDLKAGDSVIVQQRLAPDTVEKVSRTTKTMIILASGSRFNKRGSLIGGDTWNSTYLGIATPEKIQAVKDDTLKRNIIKAIQTADLKAKPLETLKKIYYLIKGK